MSDLKKIILLLSFSSSSLFSMQWLKDTLAGGMHWAGKWYNEEYRRNHIINAESKKLAADLERIAIEGTPERALDALTAEKLARFNQRCFLGGELTIELLKRNDYASIKELYEHTPPQQLNSVFKLFMLRALVQQKQELAETSGELDKLITGGKAPARTPAQIALDTKKELLQRLQAERQIEGDSLLAKFLINTTAPEKPAAASGDPATTNNSSVPPANGKPAAAPPTDIKAQLQELLGKVSVEDKDVDSSLIAQLLKQLEIAKKPTPPSGTAEPTGSKLDLPPALKQPGSLAAELIASAGKPLPPVPSSAPQQPGLPPAEAAAVKQSHALPPSPSVAAAKQPGSLQQP